MFNLTQNHNLPHYRKLELMHVMEQFALELIPCC